MTSQAFISKFREIFGDNVSLPLVYRYTNEPLAETPKIGGCFFKSFAQIEQGRAVSLNETNIGCGGGKFYTGFTEMPERVPTFVSYTERYKQTPEQVIESVAQMDIQRAPAGWLNVMRVDRVETLDDIEGMIILATPDELSGLCGWAFFDTSAPDAVTTVFGSGCSTMFANVTTENRRGGQRCFLGLFDPSVRPCIDKNKLGFGIPKSRLDTMMQTVDDCFLINSHAWPRVKERL
ncbi:MAG: DUF169 domain-containing protein [Prevotella sp.]|nr:DUF169 domain-containing protein [Prevotella sp.]